jgi:hypothetical protein
MTANFPILYAGTQSEQHHHTPITYTLKICNYIAFDLKVHIQTADKS